MPGGDHALAVVAQVGAIGNEAAVSPSTKPEYDGVIAGTGPPRGINGLEAVIVSCGSTELVDPGLGSEVTEKSLQLDPVLEPSGRRTMLSPGGMLGGVGEVEITEVRVGVFTVGTTPFACAGQLFTKAFEARWNALVA